MTTCENIMRITRHGFMMVGPTNEEGQFHGRVLIKKLDGDTSYEEFEDGKPTSSGIPYFDAQGKMITIIPLTNTALIGCRGYEYCGNLVEKGSLSCLDGPVVKTDKYGEGEKVIEEFCYGVESTIDKKRHKVYKRILERFEPLEKATEEVGRQLTDNKLTEQGI